MKKIIFLRAVQRNNETEFANLHACKLTNSIQIAIDSAGSFSSKLCRYSFNLYAFFSVKETKSVKKKTKQFD